MGFLKQTIRDVPLNGVTVLLRADYNVPLDENGVISDDFRIKASLSTVKELLNRDCKVVIISHLGRPQGRDGSCSLEQVAGRLAELLQQDVRFVDDCIGDKVQMAIRRAPNRSVVVLENLRFYPEEEANDQAFAKKLAKSSTARYYVQDGFGVVHRAHASTAAITLELPSVAGLLLEKEYTTITEAMKSPARPFVAVMGGAKVSDKIAVIERFVEKADTILIGGAMANTFLSYKGFSVGKSTAESEQQKTLDAIYKAARTKVGVGTDDFIILPEDVAVAKKTDMSEPRRVVAIDDIAADDLALDIGDKTVERFTQVIEQAGTVIWNGPVGYSTLENFAHGSARIALSLATHPQITSIIGGGDTADFVLGWDARQGESFTHVSTGGGASLELMAGERLPGVECLLDARR